ncbi:unnamed protein product [Musa hybrid cultivar]
MRGGCTVQQALTPEAATVVMQAVSLAQQRGHAQVTPLHVANIMLSSSTGLLRVACLQSHSHPLRCKALELCFNVALNRLPTSSSSGSILSSYPHHHHHHPALSNALVAAFKRAQAHQRRGSVEIQQQPLLVVKIELQQLIISILDDPSVSRVMREAGFSSTQVKSNVEQAISVENSVPSSGPYKPPGNDYALSPLAKKSRSSDEVRNEEVDSVMESLVRGRKKSVVIVGECKATCESVVRRIMERVENGDVPEALRALHFGNLSLTSYGQLSREEVEERIRELRRLVKGRSTVLYLGDLKCTTEFKISRGEKEGSSYCPLEHAIMELGRLASNGVEGECGGGRTWLLGIATYQTYMTCISGLPSLGTLWDVQPLFVPGGGSLELSLSFDSGVERQSRSKELGVGPCCQLEEDRSRKKNAGNCADCCSTFQGPKDLVSGGHGTMASSLPSWLRRFEERGSTSSDSPDSLQLYGLSKKWNTMCNSVQKLHCHHPRKAQFLSWSSPSSSLHHTPQDWPVAGNNKDSSSEFHFWLPGNAHKDDEEQLLPSTSGKHYPTIDSMEVEYTSRFKELNAENLKTLCSALEEQVPWQKDIISDIASTILQCRSGMLRRKERLQSQGTKQETWLFFQGSDFEGKVKIAMEVGRLVFGSFTDFISIGPCTLSSRSDSEASRSYFERFGEAVRDNPHRVILMEDVEQADEHSREGIKNAIRRGRILSCSSEEEVSVSDAIIIFTSESHGSRSSACSPTAKPRLDELVEEGEDSKHTESFVLDLNLSATDDTEDWSSDGVRLSEIVDRTFLLKLPQSI